MLRLPQDYRAVAKSRLACWQGSGAAHLTSRGAQSAAKTAATKKIVVERRKLCTVATGTAESRVELRLRERHNARWKNHPNADADR
jgi:hypothetical protein